MYHLSKKKNWLTTTTTEYTYKQAQEPAVRGGGVGGWGAVGADEVGRGGVVGASGAGAAAEETGDAGVGRRAGVEAAEVIGMGGKTEGGG